MRTHTNANCECCSVKMWILVDAEPICDECEEARQPLLAEIERLKAELAKFHECDFDEDGMATACDGYGVNHHSVQVWHKNG